MAPYNLVKCRKEVKEGRASGSLIFPYKKDLLFIQIFQNILLQALPGDPEHSNCCNYSNQIWCERSLLRLTHRNSSR